MDLPPGFRLTIEDQPSAKDWDRLGVALDKYNRDFLGETGFSRMGFFVRAEDSEIMAGLVGTTYAGWLFVAELWVHADLRRRGIGSRLLALAEQRAVEFGCHSAMLDTFSFQGPLVLSALRVRGLRHARLLARSPAFLYEETPEPRDSMNRPFDRLLAIMARLRDPKRGCPWDREQDFATIAPYTIEEAYEVADAIARDDMAGLKDELGDLLFQVVFHARIAEEAGLFAFDDVAAAIADKMVRRHPHVFGTAEIGSAAAQTEAWEEHKANERRARAEAAGTSESVLDGVARALPALLRAAKIQQRAARIGFDWPRGAPGHRQAGRGDRRTRSRTRCGCQSREGRG